MKEKFNDDFVLELLHIALKDKNVLEILKAYLKPEYLPSEAHKKLWRAVLTEFSVSENKKVPTFGVLKLHFRKDLEVLNLIDDLKEVDADTDDVLRNLQQFLLQNMFVETYNEVGELYNRGKKDQSFDLFVKKAQQFTEFSLKNQTFDKVFGDFQKRRSERAIQKVTGSKRVRIPTGIDKLDELTNGGFETGEFIMIVGDSGVGKSFLGNHLGTVAARLGFEVFHAQAEGTREQVLGRYDSAWTGTRYFDIKEDNIDEKKNISIQKVLNGIGGEIHVEAFEKFQSKTIVDVRNSIKELKKKCDLKYVILDYMDLVDPGDGINYGPRDERFRQQKVARACKDIAVEENVVFVTFTQASSISPEQLNDPNFVITRYHLAEDKGKIRPADVLLSINQTRDEKKNQVARLFPDKTREHGYSDVIYICQNLGRSRFYDRKRTLKEFLGDE